MPADFLLAGMGRKIASMVPAHHLPDPVTRRFQIVPLDLRRVDDLPAPLVTAIFDADNAEIADIIAACRSPRLARLPRLIVGSAELLDRLRDAVPTSDVVQAPLWERDARDLTRRVEILADLGAAWLSLELYERAMAEGVTGLTVAEPHGDDMPVVYASPTFERVTGYRPDDVLGRDCRFLQHPEVAPAARQALRKGSRERTRTQVVIRNVRKDGTPFWNEVTVFPFRAQGVDLPLVGGVQHDVTELVDARARVERLMHELVQRVAFDQAVLDALDVGVVTGDESGRITFANRAARAMATSETVDGALVREAFELRSDPWTLLAGESIVQLTHRVGASGPREVEVTLTRVDGPAIASLALIVLFRDVTTERKLQEEMRRVERLAAMGTMVAGFAHEVRNPVASLRAIAEQLDEDLAELGQSLPHASRMLKVLSRIETLVDTSLRFGRPAMARRHEHRPWQIVSAALAALLPRTRAMGGEIRIEVEPDLPSVYVDEGQLVQVLVILLDNALDATMSPRRVGLRAVGKRPEGRATDPPSAICFEVTDDGPGVPPPVIGRIFDPFFSTKPSGTGLGLSIAQQLVAENRGRIEISSVAGALTTFSVQIDPTPPPDSSRRGRDE